MADIPPPSEGSEINQPSSSQVQVDRSWEREWSLDEMRKGASNWSLAGDAGLLLYLQAFSQKLISRTHEIEQEVDNLVHDSKMASVRVNNVFNGFMMLANTQFVENRVYDEDVSQEQIQQEDKKADDQEKTREQREAELIPKVSEAIKLGVDVIEKAFEKLDTNIDNSDSEDDDESYRVDPILEAKDPYIDRTLPYLIGTPNFMQDDNVGIKDVSDDESDAGSISESETEDENEDGGKEDESEYSYSDSESQSETERPAKKEKDVFPQGSEGSDSDGDLFGTSDKKKKQRNESDSDYSDQSEDEEEDKTKPPDAPVDFASELARKLGGPTPKAPSPEPTEDRDESEEEKPKRTRRSSSQSTDKTKGKKGKKKKEKVKDDDDLFAAQGNDEDEDLFGGGTFGGKKSGDLFGDSEEDDLFGDSTKERKKTKDDSADEEEEKLEEDRPVRKKSRARTVSGKKVPVGGVSVFGTPDKSKMGGGGGGLFDDEDEDSDVFGEAKPKHKEEKKEKKADKPIDKSGGGGLFEDEDDDDLFNETPEKPKKEEPPPKKHLAGGVPMFGPPGAGNALAKALKGRSQRQESVEEEEDWTDGKNSRTGSLKSNQSGASKHSAKMGSAQSKDSLFASEPDDSLAATKPKSNSFSRNAKTAASLFDEDDEDDLFGTSSKPAQPSKTSNKTEKMKPKKSALFIDDDEDDLFGDAPLAKEKEPRPKKPAGAVSIFPTDLDPFSKKPEQEAKKEESPKRDGPVGRPPTRSISMFDGEEGDDLFAGGSAPKSPPQKLKSAPAKKSIFDDDDNDMFGGEESADIFTQAPPKTTAPPKKAEPAANVTKPQPTKVSKGPALFGGDDDNDDDDDDLFSAASSKSSRQSGSIGISGATTTDSTDSSEKFEDKVAKEKVKKPPVGGVSMFGPAAADLLGFGKKAVVQKTETVDEVVVKKPEARKAIADPLFGNNDGGDLFGGPVKKQEVRKPEPVRKQEVKLPEPVKREVKLPEPVKQEVKPEAANSKTVETSSKPTKSSGPLNIEDDDDDEDLFAGKSEAKKQPQSPTEVKPRKPVGGVSMFGGLDPFSALKKPAAPQAKSPDLSSPDNDDGDDLFSSKNEKPNEVKHTSKDEPVDKPLSASPPMGKPLSASPPKGKPLSASPPKGKIGKLQANLSFNPTAMLPGAAPPAREPEPLNVGFDVPAKVSTLQSANKDRAKIQSKRRPPSRHARTSQSPTSPTDDFFNSSASPVTSPETSSPATIPDLSDLDFDSSRVPPPISDSPERFPSPEPPQRTDLFGNDDLFSNNLPKPGAKSVIGQRKDTNSDKHSPDELFNGRNIDFPKSKTENLDDIFTSGTSVPKANSTATNDDIFSTVPKSLTKKDKPKQSVLADDDDLFSSMPKKSERAKNKSEETKKPVITDDDDDIFAVKKSKPKPKPSPIIEDDDDIFAPPSSTKPKDKNADTASVPQKSEDTLNDDDMFAVASKVEKKKPKKVVTRDEDIFTDQTDIFSDIPQSKPKEKKTKKKSTTTPKKTIFKDDIDDIFADTSASTAKPKEKKKKTTVKERTEKSKTSAAPDNPLA